MQGMEVLMSIFKCIMKACSSITAQPHDEAWSQVSRKALWQQVASHSRHMCFHELTGKGARIAWDSAHISALLALLVHNVAADRGRPGHGISCRNCPCP